MHSFFLDILGLWDWGQWFLNCVLRRPQQAHRGPVGCPQQPPSWIMWNLTQPKMVAPRRTGKRPLQKKRSCDHCKFGNPWFRTSSPNLKYVQQQGLNIYSSGQRLWWVSMGPTLFPITGSIQSFQLELQIHSSSWWIGKRNPAYVRNSLGNYIHICAWRPPSIYARLSVPLRQGFRRCKYWI